MGNFAFLEPAQIKIWVTPIGKIGLLFEKHLSAFKTATNIRLVDVSPIPSTRFNPQQNSQGRVFLLFKTNHSEYESGFLSDFEPFRRTFIVLGLGLHSDYSSEVTGELRRKYSAAITHNFVFFEAPDNKNPSQDCFFVTKDAELVITSVETILCEVIHNFLRSLNDYSSSYENITLRSPVSSIDGNALTRSIQQAQKRISSSLKSSYSNGQSMSLHSKDLKIKSSQKQSGRQAKIMGNFYLLAGCTGDAVQYFTDAAINARKADDYLWLASALEGLAVALLVLHYLGHPIAPLNPMLYTSLQLSKTTAFPGNAINRSSSESVASRKSGAATSPRDSMTSNMSASVGTGNAEYSKCQPQELLLLLCLRTSYYYRLSTLDLEDCVPDIVYVESLLRSIDFMQAVYFMGEDGVGQVMKTIFSGGEIESTDQVLSLSQYVTKESIVHEIHCVFSLEINKLGSYQICRVYAKISSVYHKLAFYRKQGFVLRQYLEALLSQLSVLGDTSKQPKGASRATINDLVDQLISIYNLCGKTENVSTSGTATWPALQLDILYLCLKTSEANHDYTTAARLCVLILCKYSHCLTKEDQLGLKEKLSRFILSMRSESSKTAIPYPDPFLIRSVVLANETRESLTPFPCVSSAKADEVVFNPYSKVVSTEIDMSKVVCAQNYQTVKVEFQNPFFFDVCVLTIEALSEGGNRVEISRDHARVLGSEYNGVGPRRATFWKDAPVPSINSQFFENGGSKDPLRLRARSVTAVELQLRPMEVGELKIRKFSVGIDEFGPQDFAIVSKELHPGSSKIKYNDLKSRQGRLLLNDLLASLVEHKTNDRLEEKSFELNVIPTQPLLSLVDNLISNGWMMLLEGERQNRHITLCNVSNNVVDYLSFSFWDTSLEAIISTLAARDSKMSDEDVYELEWQLIKRKAALITNKEDIALKHSKIEPGEEMKIDFDVYGKRAVKEMRLILEYGMKNLSDITKGFVKTLQVPLKVFVHRSVEVISCDVMPLLPTSIHELPSSSKVKSKSKNIKQLLDTLVKLKDKENEAKNFCLLVLDLRNQWRERLSVSLRFQVTADVQFNINDIIDPDHAARFLIPVKRAEHGMEFYANPIPSLQNKQFVRNSDVSEEQQAQERLSFWLRCALLEKLSGEWTTAGCHLQRSGEIDLRRIRLTPSLISALVQESVLMLHKIYVDNSKEELEKSSDDFYDISCCTFYTFQTQITNNASKAVSGTMRYIPFPVHAVSKQDLSIEKRILFNGLLQRDTGANPLEPGTSITMSLGFIVLEKGLYEWGSVFDQGNKDSGVVDREPLYIRAG